MCWSEDVVLGLFILVGHREIHMYVHICGAVLAELELLRNGKHFDLLTINFHI